MHLMMRCLQTGRMLIFKKIRIVVTGFDRIQLLAILFGVNFQVAFLTEGILLPSFDLKLSWTFIGKFASR